MNNFIRPSQTLSHTEQFSHWQYNSISNYFQVIAFWNLDLKIVSYLEKNLAPKGLIHDLIRGGRLPFHMEPSQLEQLFSLNKWNHHLKFAFCIFVCILAYLYFNAWKFTLSTLFKVMNMWWFTWRCHEGMLHFLVWSLGLFFCRCCFLHCNDDDDNDDPAVCLPVCVLISSSETNYKGWLKTTLIIQQLLC